MSQSLKERIYQAQCLGNVEPIEYMTPYPNLRGLIEGQNVKHHGKMVYSDLKMTSKDVYEIVQQIANWLVGEGLKPKQRVWVKQQSFPHSELLLFGVWAVGASVIMTDGNSDIDGIVEADLVIHEDPIPEKIIGFDPHFDPTYKSLLGDEALVFVSREKGIRLSHYNLLVNANDVQRKLDLYDDGTFFVDLEPTSTAWVILQAIFPFYTGAPMTKENPDLTIGTSDSDHNVIFDWERISEGNDLYYLPENSAILSCGDMGLHLTSYELNKDTLTVNGHSVMMGYIDDKENEKVFKEGSLVLQLNP